MEHSASYNGEVTALLVEQRHLFLSIHRTVDEAGNSIQESGDVHIYNLNEQSEQKFTAHRVQIPMTIDLFTTFLPHRDVFLRCMWPEIC